MRAIYSINQNYDSELIITILVPLLNFDWELSFLHSFFLFFFKVKNNITFMHEMKTSRGFIFIYIYFLLIPPTLTRKCNHILTLTKVYYQTPTATPSCNNILNQQVHHTPYLRWTHSEIPLFYTQRYNPFAPGAFI